jgi:hypothetical protein
LYDVREVFLDCLGASADFAAGHRLPSGGLAHVRQKEQ